MADSSSPFVQRHVGPRDADIEKMLGVVGFGSLEALMATAVPKTIAASLAATDLPEPASESQTAAELQALAGENSPLEPMIATCGAPKGQLLPDKLSGARTIG